MIVGIALGVLSIISVVTRIWARINKKAGLKWDDGMIIVSILAMIVTDVLAVYGKFCHTRMSSIKLSPTY